MTVLLLRLTGPLQSWGSRSRFSERDTEREPTKSGVVGLICAALGKPRQETANDGFPTLQELSSLRMAVRVDREGEVYRDYQTAGGGRWVGGAPYGVRRADPTKKQGETVLSNRYYLCDAVFLVALEGEESLLRRVENAVKAPAWPLFLGRKSCPPGAPLLCEDGLFEGKSLEDALASYPWQGGLGTPRMESQPDRLRVVMDSTPSRGLPRQDVPIDFVSESRRYGLRYVEERWLTLPRVQKEVEP